MSFKRALKVLFCGLLRFFRTLTTLGWRVLSKLRLRYTPQINMSGDECEFDSTWEDGDENKTPRKKMFHSHRGSRRNMFAAKDMQDFRHSCRGLGNSDDDDDGAGEQNKGHFYNLEFYLGKLRSSPDELYINDFHQTWLGEYDLLEDVHSYIQWLFPIQEPGVNWRAHVLSKKEIKLFCKDKEAKSKLVQSYKLMLDFYGICLVDESTGEVARAPNWKDRFRNLNRHTHNNLRITRILKCLGTLGLKHYQAPMVKFFLNETLVMGQLQNMKQSVLDYFLFAVLEKSERRELVKFAFKHFKPREHFVWGPRKILSGQVAHCKNENMGQPTEKNSSSAEDQQKMVNPQENKRKMNKIDASHPPKEMQSKKDHQNKDESVIPNKLTETNSESENENEGVVKKKNQDLSVGVSDGDDNENEAPANKSHGHGAVSGSHQTEEKRKKDHQNKDEPVIPNKLTEINIDQCVNKSRQCSSDNGDVVKQSHEMSVGDGDGDGVSVGDNNENIAPANKSHDHDAFDGSHQIEEKRKKDHQNNDEPVISNKLTETNSDQWANKSRPCSSENGDVVKQNHEMSVSDGDGDGVGVSDINENVAPANKSHGHDAFVVSHQTKEGSSCQVHDVEMKAETEDKESEDNHKSLNPQESKHGIEKIEASHSPEEMKSKKDHQNKNEPDVPNKLTETNSDQWANKSRPCSSENGDVVKQNHEMSVGDGVSVSDNNENIAPANKSHGHDAFCGSQQAKEGSSCQVHDVEMKDGTEDKKVESP